MKIRPPFTVRVSGSGRYWILMALRGRWARKPVQLLDLAVFLRESGSRFARWQQKAVAQKRVVH